MRDNRVKGKPARLPSVSTSSIKASMASGRSDRRADSFLPGAQLQLTALLYDGDVDTRGRQPFDVIAAQFRIHDVESLLPVARDLP